MRRFIIVVDDATPEQQDAISNHFMDSPQAYWHRFTDVWLIADPTDTMTPSKLRDEVRAVSSAKAMIVMRIASATAWSAFGKKSDFEWLKTEWANE